MSDGSVGGTTWTASVTDISGTHYGEQTRDSLVDREDPKPNEGTRKPA